MINGSDYPNLSPAKLDDLLMMHSEVVFARITPQQKLAVVESLQRMGHVVTVTGNSADDVPAMTKADVGEFFSFFV